MIKEYLENRNDILMFNLSENGYLSYSGTWNAFFFPIEYSYFFDGYYLIEGQ